MKIYWHIATVGGSMLSTAINYTYKGGKLIYNLVSRNGGKTTFSEINEDDIPDRFKCQLTGKVMEHPVVCPCECYFEKERALEALETSGGYCPIHTGEKITEGDLRDADWLAVEIEEFWAELAKQDAVSFEVEDDENTCMADKI